MEKPESRSESVDNTRPCPFCQEHIFTHAKKCKHCGESVSRVSKVSRVARTFVGFVGLITAALSLFYALREGYFYIEERQQQRAEIRSYLDVAAQFQQLDSLDYAERAMAKALELSPSDASLQRHYFLLRSDRILQEVEWRLVSGEESKLISELVLDGFRLIRSSSDAPELAQLLVIVARLLPHTSVWNDAAKIIDFYEQALTIGTEGAESYFRYGQWLFEAEVDEDKGVELMRQAIQIAPDNALYHYELGNKLLNKGELKAALNPLMMAKNLLPKQRRIANLRASNSAKSALRRWVIEADKKFEIHSDDFLGLCMEERYALIKDLLNDRNSDREINMIAARLAYAQQEFEVSLAYLKNTQSDRDFSRQVQDYNLAIFNLYRDNLSQLPSQQAEFQRVEQALQFYHQNRGIEESLEFGIEGRNRYKVGLRVDTKSSGNGVYVVESFSGYPFYNAGVRAGDRIIKLAHREVNNLQSIYILLDKFDHKTSVPMVIARDGEQLELNFIVE